MILNQKHKTKTFDEVLQDPEQPLLHEAIHFLRKTSFKDAFPRKYEISVIDMATETVTELFEENPNTSLKTVVSAVMEQLPDDISALLLSKVVKQSIEEWENLTASIQKENQTFLMV